MKNIFINPTRKTLIALSVLLSMCICKSIIKPVYAEFQQDKKRVQEVSDLIINKEENIIQNSEDIPTNKIKIEIPSEVLTENIEDTEVQEEAIIHEEIPQNSILQVEESNPWRLIIQAINLDAGIKEGTRPEILDTNIGHLETTSVYEGTVALCAHNRGYTKNYFSELKNLNTR